MWFCRDHSFFIREVAALTKKQFDIYETDSLLKGGQEAGQFLDTIGQTDLAELNPDQFVHFFAKFLSGYEDNMKKVFEGMVEK